MGKIIKDWEGEGLQVNVTLLDWIHSRSAQGGVCACVLSNHNWLGRTVTGINSKRLKDNVPMWLSFSWRATLGVCISKSSWNAGYPCGETDHVLTPNLRVLVAASHLKKQSKRQVSLSWMYNTSGNFQLCWNLMVGEARVPILSL